MKNILRILLLVALFSGILLKMHAQSSDGRGSDTVRVAILDEAKDFIFSVRGSYRIIDPATEDVLGKGRVLKRSRVKAKGNGIVIGRKQYPLKHLRISTKKDVAIRIEGKDRRFRGNVDIILKDNNKFLVVNALDLEKYIKGVLYHEVSDRWPMEAMKAQAVAVRTYTLYHLETNFDNLYDVKSNVYSQVYGGRSAERYRTSIAVNRTKGEVMMYEGKVIPAYYHSHCGGHTEDVRELWNHDLVPLRGVVCEFCQNAPHNEWKKNFQSKKVQKKLNENGCRIGPIKEIVVMERNTSGRIKQLKIIDRKEKNILISGKTFRQIIGPNELKSNSYDVVMKGYYFDAIGKGWGHGVGMCQWGANEMARKRHDYKKILNFYYPGVTVTRLKEK